MQINEEMLSAFLDGELPPAEMAAIRQQLQSDVALADRLAELAAVDERVRRRYAAIDERPLPESVKRLLSAEQQGAKGHVVPLSPSSWRTRLQRPISYAVAAALVVGFGLGQMFDRTAPTEPSNWTVIAGALETAASGERVLLSSGTQLLPRLVFINSSGEFCRQYQLQQTGEIHEQIACRRGSDPAHWQPVASVQVMGGVDADRYQLASGAHLLDAVLDQMIVGDLITPAQERRLRESNWSMAGD